MDALKLTCIASGEELICEVLPKPGDFLTKYAPVMRVWGARDLDDGLRGRLLDSISVEPERSMRGDVLFGVRQLVDISNKALSLAINDPTTAVQVLDELHQILRRVAECEPRPGVYCDENGTPRVFVARPSWNDFLVMHSKKFFCTAEIHCRCCVV